MNKAEKEIYEYSKELLERGSTNYCSSHEYVNRHTERCIEVPWLACGLNRFDVHSLLDIGFTFASHDYLRLILDYAKENELCGTDIIDPLKVKSRYPSEWYDEIMNIPIFLMDISKERVDKKFDAVTLISTMEHIGFDAPSVTVTDSAFERATEKENVKFKRDDEIESKVLDNIGEMLNEQGYCFISVPAGRGGQF